MARPCCPARTARGPRPTLQGQGEQVPSSSSWAGPACLGAGAASALLHQVTVSCLTSPAPPPPTPAALEGAACPPSQGSGDQTLLRACAGRSRGTPACLSPGGQVCVCVCVWGRLPCEPAHQRVESRACCRLETVIRNQAQRHRPSQHAGWPRCSSARRDETGPRARPGRAGLAFHSGPQEGSNPSAGGMRQPPAHCHLLSPC